MARATYQPLADAGVQPLADSAVTLASFAALVFLGGTRKPTRLVVGRLHYSLRSTLSAHFRWCFRASERLNIAS
jgi:hypothetical protein